MTKQSVDWKRLPEGGLIEYDSLPKLGWLQRTFSIPFYVTRLNLEQLDFKIRIYTLVPRIDRKGVCEVKNPFKLSNFENVDRWMLENRILSAYEIAHRANFLPDLAVTDKLLLDASDPDDPHNVKTRLEAADTARILNKNNYNRHSVLSRITLRFQSEEDLIFFKFRWL